MLQVAIYHHLANEQKRESAVLATRVKYKEKSILFINTLELCFNWTSIDFQRMKPLSKKLSD